MHGREASLSAGTHQHFFVDTWFIDPRLASFKDIEEVSMHTMVVVAIGAISSVGVPRASQEKSNDHTC